jgi:hypothetical protein
MAYPYNMFNIYIPIINPTIRDGGIEEVAAGFGVDFGAVFVMK